MDFTAIINRAFALVRNNQVLWKLGLVVIFTEGVTAGWGWSWPSPPTSDKAKPPSDPEFDRFVAEATNWLRDNLELAISLGVVILVVMLALWYLSIRAKGGFILEIERLESNQPAGSFREILGRGREFVWKLVGLHLTFAVVSMIVSGVMAGIVAGIFTASTAAAIFVFLALIPFFFAALVYLNFLLRISERHLVLSRGTIMSGVKLASSLIRRRFSSSLISVAIEFGLSILFMLAIIGVVVVSVGLGAFLIMLISWLLPTGAAAVVAGILVTLLAVGIFFIAGWFAAYMVTYWTLVYRAFSYIESQPTKKEIDGRSAAK